MTEEERELLILLAEMMYRTYAASLTLLYKDDFPKVIDHMNPIRDRLAKLIAKLESG